MTGPQRVLAHRIIWGDRHYTMSVASAVCAPDGSWTVSVEPFTAETPATVFVSGIVTIVNADGTTFLNGDSQPPVFRH